MNIIIVTDGFTGIAGGLTIGKLLERDLSINYKNCSLVQLPSIDEDFNKFPKFVLKIYKFIKSIFFINKYYKEENIIINIGFYPSIISFFSIKMGARVIVSLHSSYNSLSLMKKILFICSIKKADFNIALTSGTKFLIPKFLCNKTFVIPNYIDIPFVKLKNRKKHLIYCGRFDKNKNVADLVFAYAISNLSNMGWTLLLIGDGPELGFIRDQISALKLSNSVKILGELNHDQICFHYASSSIYVSSSLSEGLPLSYIEALTFGLPIVTYDCMDRTTDIVTNDYNGFVSKKTPVDMANILNKLSGSDVNLEYLSINAKNSSSMFSKELVVGLYANLLSNLSK